MSDTWDPHKFLHTPIYAFNFQCMIGDMIDFLEFSEANIEWQRRRELQEIKRREVIESFPVGYREHLEENAKFRFCVSLPLQVRYAAVTSLVTSVEWSINNLAISARVSVSRQTKSENKTIRLIKQLQIDNGVKCEEDVQIFSDLVNVRNCIAHNGGLIKGDRKVNMVKEAIDRLDGFSLGNEHFIGTHVHIQKGALNAYADKMKHFVVELHKL